MWWWSSWGGGGGCGGAGGGGGMIIYLHRNLSLNRRGRWGTTDDFTTISSIFLCFPLPSGTSRTPGLFIPLCCLPTSSSVCLVFFPLLLCLARWFCTDLMNGRHTTSVCVSFRWSGLRVVQAHTSSLVTWSLYEMSSILIVVAPHVHGLYSFLELCCRGP